MPHDHDNADRTPGGSPRGIGSAIDPIGQLLGTILGMRNLGPSSPGRSSPGPPGGTGRPTISIRRGSNEGRSNSGSGMQFSFRSGSGGTSGSTSRFGMFEGMAVGTGRRGGENRDPEPPSVDEQVPLSFS